MNLRSFSLFALNLCFLFPSVGFSMDDETRVVYGYPIKEKVIILEDLVQRLDSNTKISLLVTDQSYDMTRSVESVRALEALGDCFLCKTPLMTLSDDDFTNLSKKDTAISITIKTTAEKLKILCDNRDPIRKAIFSMAFPNKFEGFENYINTLEYLRPAQERDARDRRI